MRRHSDLKTSAPQPLGIKRKKLNIETDEVVDERPGSSRPIELKSLRREHERIRLEHKRLMEGMKKFEECIHPSPRLYRIKLPKN